MTADQRANLVIGGYLVVALALAGWCGWRSNGAAGAVAWPVVALAAAVAVFYLVIRPLERWVDRGGSDA